MNNNETSDKFLIILTICFAIAIFGSLKIVWFDHSFSILASLILTIGGIVFGTGLAMLSYLFRDLFKILFSSSPILGIVFQYIWIFGMAYGGAWGLLTVLIKQNWFLSIL